ncbi:MAG TPA: hypothetical protein DCW90_23830 [Lachnospiraceae bacterium]|nr:hypothetical protein [Lachnospiraceae bacterium]
MSVRHKDKLVGTTWNYIKDDKSAVNSTYSSEKTNVLATGVQDENDRLVALTKGVRDVTHSYDELQNYPVDTLVIGDVINVLKDETRDDGSTYYRWDGQLPFVYIGQIPPFYTKLETDTKLDGKQNILVDGVNIKTIGGQSLLGTGDLTFTPDNLKWFPVGTIYPAYNNIDPNDFIGGKWELISDRFLRQATSDDTFGSTGGQETVTLNSADYLPWHSHSGASHVHTITTDAFPRTSLSTPSSSSSTVFALPVIRGLNSNNNTGSGYCILVMKKTSGGGWYQPGYSDWIKFYDGENVTSTEGKLYSNDTTTTCQNTGGGQAHNNMHRYLAVNYWVRVE